MKNEHFLKGVTAGQLAMQRAVSAYDAAQDESHIDAFMQQFADATQQLDDDAAWRDEAQGFLCSVIHAALSHTRSSCRLVAELEFNSLARRIGKQPGPDTHKESR